MKPAAPSAPPAAAAPTLILPRGTRIETDAHGQLSIRAPGHLVIQNSGRYGDLESAGGSIRIERDVEVEAVNVRCAEACFVQGSLTAWKVSARTLHLEEGARAQVVLQETERLEIGRGARLVGNFPSENELFLLFSRFARQVRALPFLGGGAGERLGAQPVAQLPASEIELPPPAAQPPVPSAPPAPVLELRAIVAPPASLPSPPPRSPASEQLSERLLLALALLEREAARPGHPPAARRALDELVRLLAGGDLDILGPTHRTLFARIAGGGPDVRRAADLVAAHFAR